jgi:NAD(P)-dependent dehydrogenase (short-subunit alcohol dehydrogenase family)
MTSVSFSLDAETALVTGGASGIGAAVALAIAEQGGQVAIVDLPGTDFSSTLDAIARAGGKALSIEADVTSLEQLEDAVARTEAELGALSLAVNSAGIANAAPAEDMPLAQWQKVYDIDVTGVFLSCQAEGRAMLRSGRGSIVNIASMSGTIVNRGLMQVHYNSAKAAVQHLSKSLAMEWAERGVRVNSISPGYTMTPMNSRPEMVDQMAQFASETPMQRVAEPREIAGPVVFLLSGAASFCTGTDLLVDGGFCAW